MENSVLSDAAGVQKNISKMYEEYAQKIGKSTDALTQAEKAQAVYNGIMAEAGMYTGSAAEMAEGYQGQQAQLNASSLELSRTLGETMIPALTQINSLGLSLTQTLNSFIENNKGATTGIITFVTSLGTLALAITAVIKVMQSYKTAVDTLNMSTKALKITMASAFAVSAILASIVAVTTAINEQKEAQKELSEAQEFHNQVLSKTIELNNENVSSIKTRKKEMEDYLSTLQDYNDNETTIAYAQLALDMGATGETADEFRKVIKECTDENIALGATLVETSDNFKKLYKIEKDGLVTTDDLNGYIKIYSDRLNEANAIQKIKSALDTSIVQNQKKEAAQLKLNANQMQEYLNVVKKGDTSTSEYQNAVKKLAETYPEAANAQGIIIDKAQDYINAEQMKADQSWNTVQQIINGNIDVINSYIQMAKEAENDTAKQQELANSIGIAYSNIIPTLTSVLNIITAIGNQNAEEVSNITPTTVSTPRKTSSGSSTKSYSNKALDNYKSLIEYKKSLDKISLEEEIKMYQTALNKYAKTTEEKRELKTKIYELEKELQEQTLDDYVANIEYKKSLDKISLQEEIDMYKTALEKYAKTTDQKRELTTKIYELEKELQEENFSDYMTKIERAKSLNKISTDEEMKLYEYAYNKLATTTEQKEEIEQKLYDLRKELAQKEKDLIDEQTKNIEDNMKEQEQLQGAAYDIKDKQKSYDKLIKLHADYLEEVINDERLSLEERKQIYEEELETIKSYEEQKRNLRVQSIDDTVSQLTNAIKKQLEEMEDADKKAIESNIELVEKWKDARISAINEEYNTRIDAIQKELDLLDKSEEEKTRAEEDAEYERKRNRLQELINYEHDAVTKANYQKELDKLVADYQDNLDKRALQDKKDALKEKQELLKEEQDSKVEAIENEAEKQKTQYETQLDELEKYYKAQQDKAQETAEKMLLNVEQNQDKILELLQDYGDAYEITGQSLGEKLAQGINDGVASKIENVIKTIQNKIDTGIENKIKSWTSSIDNAQSSSSKTQTTSKTITVNQTNNIVQNPEMPSETYRKMQDMQRALAAQLAGA